MFRVCGLAALRNDVDDPLPRIENRDAHLCDRLPRLRSYLPDIRLSSPHQKRRRSLKAVFFTEYLRADQVTRLRNPRKKSSMSQSPSTNPQRSVIHLLRRVDQCAAQLYTTESADNDLTLRQLAILTAISRQENLSQTDLVAITGIDRSTVAGIVSRLLRKGLLERKRSPLDGRAYCVRLSKRGQKAVSGADRLYSRVEKKLLASVPAAEASKFVSTLKTILSAHADDEQTGASA